MSEQYFEITPKSEHYAEYFKYLEDREQNRMAVKKFFSDYGIAGEHYGLRNGKLWVEDIPVNREKFGSQLSKNCDKDGTVFFKKNSKIGKAWAALDVKTPNKPFVPFFFSGALGRVSSRRFSVEDKVYCSAECLDYDVELTAPDGFVEIQASEFYRAAGL